MESSNETRLTRFEVASRIINEHKDRTLYHLIERTIKNKNPSSKYLGTVTHGTYPTVSWLTYKAFGDLRTRVGSFIVETCNSLGIERPFVALYSNNRIEWNIVEAAVNAYSLVLVPFYRALSVSGVSYCLEDSGSQLFVGGKEETEVLCKALNDKVLSTLKAVILLDAVSSDTIATLESHGLSLYRWSEVVDFDKRVPHVPPSPETVASVIYTSGTTGKQKGVVLTHENLYSETYLLNNFFGFFDKKKCVYYSILSAAHIYERGVQIVVTSFGGRICFMLDRTKIQEEIVAARPTLLVGVPRLYKKFIEAFNAKIKALSLVKRTVVGGYVHLVKRGWLPLFVRNFVSRLLFREFRERFGDNVSLLISGSSPIRAEQARLLRELFLCPFVQGYGLTEAGIVSMAKIGDERYGHVGVVRPGLEIRVSPEGVLCGATLEEGEGLILLRGSSVFGGYFGHRESVELKNGWLNTGDIGSMQGDRLYLKGRERCLYKLPLGEFVNPELLEEVFRSSEFVEDVYVHVDSLRDDVVSIVYPNFEECKREDACSDDDVKELLLNKFEALVREGGMPSYNVVKDMIIKHEPFSIEQGELTTTFKFIRGNIERLYHDKLEAVYKSIGSDNV